VEPFRDSAHRRLLTAHAAAGDRGEALRAYDRYRRVLAEELGVGPPPTWRRPTWSCSTPSRPPSARPPPACRRRPARSRAPSWAAGPSCAGCAPPGPTPGAAGTGPCW
jgi:hypothetical protein